MNAINPALKLQGVDTIEKHHGSSKTFVCIGTIVLIPSDTTQSN